MLLEGVFAAIPTPFQPDGRPHWHHMERNVERYCRAPLAGLVVLGSTGEAVMLNDEETREALRVAGMPPRTIACSSPGSATRA